MKSERHVKAGRLGAATVKERLGTEHFTRMGRMGGKALLEKRGREFFMLIGKKGGEIRWQREREKADADQE